MFIDYAMFSGFSVIDIEECNGYSHVVLKKTEEDKSIIIEVVIDNIYVQLGDSIDIEVIHDVPTRVIYNGQNYRIHSKFLRISLQNKPENNGEIYARCTLGGNNV